MNLAVNIVVLQGSLSRPAQTRSLPSGDRLVALEVTIPRAGDRAESVPVVWLEAPASAAELDVGEKVVVVGRVRRRYFRAGGVTQSRTEVVADTVVPARRSKRARAAVAQGLARIADLGAETGGCSGPTGDGARQATDRNTMPVLGLG